jgi:hypothetical protein
VTTKHRERLGPSYLPKEQLIGNNVYKLCRDLQIVKEYLEELEIKSTYEEITETTKGKGGERNL